MKPQKNKKQGQSYYKWVKKRFGNYENFAKDSGFPYNTVCKWKVRSPKGFYLKQIKKEYPDSPLVK